MHAEQPFQTLVTSSVIGMPFVTLKSDLPKTKEHYRIIHVGLMQFSTLLTQHGLLELPYLH